MAKALQKKMLIIISGPSGVGKGIVVSKLIKNFSDLSLSISATTRRPRKNEIDGLDYFFLEKKDFLKHISENKFVEWANVHGELYGTLKSQLLKQLQNKAGVLLELDVQGALQIRELITGNKFFPFPVQNLFIFLTPPSIEDLVTRLKKRQTESSKVMKKRIKHALVELQLIGEYDHIIVNDDLKDTVNQIKEIIEKERRNL
jgi:guanylate kinase